MKYNIFIFTALDGGMYDDSKLEESRFDSTSKILLFKYVITERERHHRP